MITYFFAESKQLLLGMNRVHHVDLQVVVRVYAVTGILYVELLDSGSG